MKLREIALGEAIHVKHGYAFKGQFFSEVGTYIVLTPGNFNEGGGFRLRPGKDRYYADEIPEDFILGKDDLIVAMTEQGPGLLGSSAMIPESGRYLHNQRIGLIDQLDESLLSTEYLYYLFNTRSVRGQISGSASGTKVRHTSPDRIYRVKTHIPDVLAQRKISSILSTYDYLIENNLRRIELLEKSARLLYEEWFVRLRFPGYEHTRIKNGVPEEWEKKKIEDICKTIGGGTPSTKKSEYWEGGSITWITPTDITKNNCLVLLDSAKKITEEGLKHSSAKLLPPNSILMTSRASVGFFGLIDEEVCTNQGFISIIPKNEYLRMYLLHNLMNRREEILSYAKGSTYREINKTTFRAIDVVIPLKNIMESFYDFAYDVVRQTKLLQREIKKLKQARDLLLPKLMNGEIAV